MYRNSEKILMVMGSIIILLLIALIIMQVSFRRFPGRKMMHDHREKQFVRMMDEIGVSQEQKDKLTKVKDEHKKEIEKLQEIIQVKREVLGTELGKEVFNKPAIFLKHKELKEVLMQKEDYLLKMILSLGDILTSEQRVKVHQRMGKMPKRMGDMPPPDMM